MLGRLQRQAFRATTIEALCAQVGWFQDAVQTVVNALTADPSADYVEQTVALSGATVVAHKLGRVPVGWQIVDIDAAATVHRSAASDDKHLTLTTTAPCTVKLRVW